MMAAVRRSRVFARDDSEAFSSFPAAPPIMRTWSYRREKLTGADADKRISHRPGPVKQSRNVKDH